jgi:hypothetical protein
MQYNLIKLIHMDDNKYSSFCKTLGEKTMNKVRK